MKTKFAKIQLFLAWGVTLSAVAVGAFLMGATVQRERYRSISLSITAHLHGLDSAALMYFEEHKDIDQISYAKLVDQGNYMPRRVSSLGEDYDSIFISRDRDFISVRIPGTHFCVMREVSYSRIEQ
jgi:hypothetical protein